MLGFPFFLLSRIIPKKQGLSVYGSQSGHVIGDNSLALFSQKVSEPNQYFITKNRRLLSMSLPGDKLPTLAISIRGIWLQLRAETVYYSHSIFDLSSPLVTGGHVVCLQHGFPIKLGGVAARQNSWLMKASVRFVVANLIPYIYYYYADEVWSPNQHFIENTRAVFALTTPEILVRPPSRLSEVEIKPEAGNILIALTHSAGLSARQKLYDLGLLLESDHKSTTAIPESLKITVRLHPIDKEGFDIRTLRKGVCFDVSENAYKSLGSYEAVLTDFSSLGFDSAHLGIRTVFWIQHLDSFNESEIGLFPNVVSDLKRIGVRTSDEAWASLSQR